MEKHQSARNTGPLSLYMEGFREHLAGRGYTPESARWRLRQLEALNRWLHDHELSAGDLDAGCVGRLVTERRAKGRKTMVSVANFSVPIAYLRGIAATWLPSVALRRVQYQGICVSPRISAAGKIGRWKSSRLRGSQHILWGSVHARASAGLASRFHGGVTWPRH